jgi:HEAT repeat protein
MRRPTFLCTLAMVACAAFALSAFAGQSVDTYIKQLKDKDPVVRANAAYELSCG